MSWQCRVLGHRFAFRAEGRSLVWECTRDCGTRHSKEYATAAEASRYARAFQTRPGENLGERAPLIGMFPLRLWHRLRRGGRQGR